MGKFWVEVCLISARGLRRTSSFWKLQWFAVGWIDANNKYCTKIDACGNSNPVWKTKFASLLEDSSFEEATLQVEVYSREPIFLRESLQGTATVALKEFLAKHSNNSEGPRLKIEEVGSYQLRKKNSNKPQGFVDVSVRVSEEKDEPSPYPGNEGGFVLMDRSNNATLPNEGVTSNDYPAAAVMRPQSPFQHPGNHSQFSSPYNHQLPYPSNASAGGGPSHAPAPGPSYQYQPPRRAPPPAPGPGPSYQYQAPRTPPPPPPPPPSNAGYIPTLLPRAELGGGTYMNMPSSAAGAATYGRGVRPGVAMGLGAGALAAGAVIFGDDFMSGFHVPTGLQDASLTIATDPLF